MTLKETISAVEIFHDAFGIKNNYEPTIDLTEKDIASRKLKDKSGVIIQEVDVNGPLSDVAVSAGDIIIALQNKKIKDVTDFEQRLKKEIKSGSKSLLLTIVDSQNRSRYVGVKIK